VRLVTSDAHRGLVAAIGATLPGASWQRCRTHYATNLMAVTPKSSWPWVRALLHSVYDQPDAAAVAAHRPSPRHPDRQTTTVAEHLDDARADLLAFTAFPKELWRQIWSNNPMVIWSRSTGVRDIVDEQLRSPVLRGGRGYIPPSSTRRCGRSDVRSAGGVARFAA
jgi:putative transposase